MAATPTAARVRRPHPATVVVVVLVVALGVWNGLEASQHLLTDRDPGVHVTTARWLAREGTVLVDPEVGPFAGRADLGFEEQGWNLDGEGRLEPQFLHLLPVLLAAAHVVGGDRLLLLAPAALGSAALLAFHVFARRLVRPWWASVATAALGLDLVWVHLSRDAFSELPAVLLLFAGLAVLSEARSQARPALALVAGLLLGGVATARVEGFVLLLPLAAAVAVELVLAQRASPTERRTIQRIQGALVAGAALTAAVALVDLLVFSTWYLDDLGGLLRALVGGLAVTVVVGGVAVGAAVRRRQAGDASPRAERRRSAAGPRRRLATAAAVAVAVVFAALWFARPALSTVTGEPNAAIAAIERAEGRAAEGVRRYSEHSVEWLAWYLGPVAVVAGIAGLAVLVHRLVRAPRPDLRPLPFVLVFATISLLYLWRPSIVPDHIWVMRRYAVVTIPGLVLLATVAGQAGKDRLAAEGAAAPATWAGAALVVALVAFPVATVLPVAGTTTQEGALEKVGELCDAVGDDGAVVVLPGRELELVTGQALRSFCGVPVAIAEPSLGADDVASLADAWALEGRSLHLVGSDVTEVEAAAGRPAEATVVIPDDQRLEATLTARPDELASLPRTFVVADVSPGG